MTKLRKWRIDYSYQGFGMVGSGGGVTRKGQVKIFVVTEQLCIWPRGYVDLNVIKGHRTMCTRRTISILFPTLLPHVVYLHHDHLHPLSSFSWYLGHSSQFCFHASKCLRDGSHWRASCHLLATYLKFCSSTPLAPPVCVLPSSSLSNISHPWLFLVPGLQLLDLS